MPTADRQVAYWVLAAALAGAITLTNQVWVGGRTIYAPDKEVARARLHTAILENRLPDDVARWGDIGAESTNIRVLTIWAAEGVRRVCGVSIHRAYLIVETAAVFVCAMLLFSLMKSCVGPEFGLIAILYLGAVLPLTYFLHYFHPWDKASLCIWIAALICVHSKRWLLLIPVLMIGVLIKFDIVVFPVFVFLAAVRQSTWQRAALLSALFVAVTFGTYGALLLMRPAEAGSWSTMQLVTHNISEAVRYGWRYPPLLVVGMLAPLALSGYPVSNGFAKAGVEFAAVLTLILFLQTFVEEVRAILPLLPLLMPAAAVGAQRLIREEAVGPPRAHLRPTGSSGRER